MREGKEKGDRRGREREERPGHVECETRQNASGAPNMFPSSA